jgi:hypothetical protein
MREPPSAIARPPSSHKKRFLLIGAAVFVGLILLGWGWYTYLAISGAGQLEEAVAGTEALDPGWRMEELEARRPALPDAENSAVCVLKARGLLPSPWPTPQAAEGSRANGANAGGTNPHTILDDLAVLSPEVALTTGQARQLGGDLEKASSARNEARHLEQLMRGHYTVAWAPNPSTTVSPCQAARNVVNLLWMDGVLRAQQGDADGALASGRAALNAGRSIGEEPALISQLVRISCQAVAIRSLERSLAQGEPTPAALEAAQRLLEDEVAQPLLLFGTRGERALIHRMFEGVRTGTITPAQLGGATGWQALLTNLGASAFLTHSHAPFLRTMTDAVEVAKLPLEKQPGEWQRLDGAANAMPVLVRLWVPAFTRVAKAFQRAQATLRTAIVGLAAERYRRARGQWPQSLTDVVRAGFLQEVPLDPYGGASLRSRRLSGGVVIYSVGPDGKDDGGTVDRQNSTAPGTDIGFQLWDVSQRHRVPAAAPSKQAP